MAKTQPYVKLAMIAVPYLDGHASAVEALREQHPLAGEPMVGARELELRASTADTRVSSRE